MMNKMRDLLSRIPRPVKALFFVLCALSVALLYYIAKDSPTLSFEQEFRRAEKANLVGPSRIVEVMDSHCSDFHQMIVGETDHGICFFGGYSLTVHYDSNFKREETWFTFSYREKTGDITVLAAPNGSHFSWDVLTYYLPVYVFDNYPQAVRAELELTVTGSDTRGINGEKVTTNFSKRFTATSERTGEGFFRFLLEAKGSPNTYALELLSDLCGTEMYSSDPNIDAVVPGTVRLYDAEGKLILEHEFEICSAQAAAHK